MNMLTQILFVSSLILIEYVTFLLSLTSVDQINIILHDGKKQQKQVRRLGLREPYTITSIMSRTN